MTAPTPTTGVTPTVTPASPGGAPPPAQPAAPSRPRAAARLGDRIFSGLSTSAGVLILITLAGVATFLVTESLPVLTASADEIPGDGGFLSYLAPLLFGTVLAAVLALVLATPLAIGIALFISHYAPRRLSRLLGYLTDLLAAIPSVIYGLWGALVLAPYAVPSYQWLERTLGFLPFFSGPVTATGRTILTAGIVLSVMILPIMAAINREVFLQTPALHEEAALALGATRWEMIRMTVIPYGKSGVIGGAMLGLGRALGETIAVLLVLSASGGISFNLIGQANPPTIPSNIAAQFPEATGLDIPLLIATGLVLFTLTFVVNFAARAVVARRAEFDGAAG